jgi:Zn-finger nucleic acid-binding protein
MLLCPTCKEHMRSRSMSNFQVDECPLCDGLWFDDQEPEKMVCTAAAPQYFFEPIAFDDSRKVVPEGQRRCPRCETVMDVFSVREVSVDVCTSCRGMWLDRRELQKILGD